MDKLDPKARAAALGAFVAAGGGSFIVDMPSRPLDAALKAYEAERAGAGAVPAGWKLVPIKATAENGMKAALIGEYKIKREIPAENPEDHANGEYASAEFTITWTEMKELYDLFLAAAPPAPLAPPQGEGAAIKTRSNSDVAPLDAPHGGGQAPLPRRQSVEELTDQIRALSKDKLERSRDYGGDVALFTAAGAHRLRELANEIDDLFNAHNPPAPLAPKDRSMEISDAQIKHMVDRFLMWRLPDTFGPDGGIVYLPDPTQPWPVGTNLLDATQANAMARHMIEGMLPAPPLDAAAVRESALREAAAVADAEEAKCMAEAARSFGQFQASWQDEAERAALIAAGIRALIAPAAPEGEGRDHG